MYVIRKDTGSAMNSYMKNFNVIGCTVYVLPIDLSDPIQLDMISVQ